MSCKKLMVLFGLGIALSLLVSGSAAAQTYSVLSTSHTYGFPGTYKDSVAITGTSASTMSNPPGYTWPGGTHSAEVYADSFVTMGRLESQVDAAAIRHFGDSFPNNGPIAYTESRFADTVNVESATLPVNTPVTLVFHNRIAVPASYGSGLYDGYLSAQLQVATSIANVRWELNHNNPPQPVPTPQIVIQTKVGARLYLKDRLLLEARGFFYLPNPPRYSGGMGITATVDLEVETSDDVTLRGDSGVLYTVVR